MAGETRFVIPAAGAVVQYPDTKTALPPEGASVAWDTYWQRRVNDGSVTVKIEAEKSSEPVTDTGYQKSERGRTR
jgi:hypothetical protein